MSMDGRPRVISVIVPVYEVEAYLEECVNSILNQTYQDLEIIIVDDGSPDSCPALCDAFAERDNRVKVIHQENRGVAEARNAGLDAATGEYIVFCDSDDMIPPSTYMSFVEQAKNSDADIICGAIESIDDGGCVRSKWAPDAQKARTGMLALEHPLVNATMFRTCFLRRHNLKFYNSIIGEDAIFSARLFLCRPRIVCIKETAYWYRLRGAEITPSLSQRKDFTATAARIGYRVEEAKIAVFYRDKTLMAFCAGMFFPALEIWYQSEPSLREGLFALIKEYANLFYRRIDRKIIADWCGVSCGAFLQMDERSYRLCASDLDWEKQRRKHMIASGQMGLKEVAAFWRADRYMIVQYISKWMYYKVLSARETHRKPNLNVRFFD